MLTRQRRTVLAVTFAVLGLSVTACTSDGDGGPAAAVPASATVEVTLIEFAIEPTELRVPGGQPFTVRVVNAGSAPHTYGVEVDGQTIESDLINGGETAELAVPALEAGTYVAICTVAGHADLGMTGTVLASADGAVADPGQDVSGGTGATDHGTDHSGLTAEQMAEFHQKTTTAFPAETQGRGNEVLEPTMDGDVKVFDLTSQVVQWEIEPGVFKEAFAYNGTVPGPQLRVDRGERVRVVLHNELPQPTTLHFHGLTVPNAMDGVPYVTQDPIMPGEHFVYEFTVRDPPGTYVYHSHFNSTEQVGKGQYGAFIVEPDGEPVWDVEYTLFTGDGPLDYGLNGKSFPATEPLVAKRGQKVLVRMANDGAQLHPMHLHGFRYTVLAQDGVPLRSPYEADTLVVAPGQRFDILIEAKAKGVWAFHCHILPHVEGPEGMFGMVTALVVD